MKTRVETATVYQDAVCCEMYLLFRIIYEYLIKTSKCLDHFT